MNKKAIQMGFGIVLVAFIFTFSMAPYSRLGQLQGRFHIGTTSAILNGVGSNDGATITGTPFALSGSTGDISIFYQATQATSTPHYKIAIYTSPNNATYTTELVATLTASSDETSTDFKHRVVSIDYSPWARIDIIGITGNATGTTFDLLIPYQ